MTEHGREAERLPGNAAPSARHQAIVAELDAMVRALPPSRPLYSKDLAQQAGLSVRTLQLAVRSVTGFSLHHYLRQQRLLRVRHELLTGAPSVKAAALANGFWHLGDFSRLYIRTFGESPSQTRVRSSEEAASAKLPAAGADWCRCHPALDCGPVDAPRFGAGSRASAADR